MSPVLTCRGHDGDGQRVGQQRHAAIQRPPACSLVQLGGRGGMQRRGKRSVVPLEGGGGQEGGRTRVT